MTNQVKDDPATKLTINLDLPLCIMWYRQSQLTEEEDLLYFRYLPSSVYIKFHSQIERMKTT